MAKVYLKVFTTDSLCQVPIETLITLFTIKYCDSNVQILLVKSTKPSKENSFLVDLSTFQYKFIECNEMSKIVSSCELPNFEENEKSCMAGLCATLRQIIKDVLVERPDHHSRELLGFKESCLLCCSETSIWTRFCEIDIVSTLRSLVKQNQGGSLPVALARFETHMSQPIKLHNVYKYLESKKFAGDKVNKSRNTLPEHVFAEGLSLTLADIIIFVCVHALLTFVSKKQIRDVVPLTMKWYDNVSANERVARCLDILCLEDVDSADVVVEYSLPVIENQSMYKCDPKRYRPQSRIYTRQEDIDYALGKIHDSQLRLYRDESRDNEEEEIDWSNIPYEATPEGGDLPSNRLQRKLQQLESLVKPALKLAKKGDVIVDFCSGGGHLGILLAYLLPECSVILLENKPESMKRAKERVSKLSLTNVSFSQSNLDYFKGRFDIGLCLHACGVATDMVLQQCIDRDAAFVCCPCCYGSIQECPKIFYPRSKAVKEILEKRSYLVLGHASDQTHADHAKTKQGYECMTVIDTDRLMQAEEHGYRVRLSKLKPETCSLKNHLLIGWPRRLKSAELDE